ncbi:MAG: hypothetical protein V1663_03910 [archaeon]
MDEKRAKNDDDWRRLLDESLGRDNKQFALACIELGIVPLEKYMPFFENGLAEIADDERLLMLDPGLKIQIVKPKREPWDLRKKDLELLRNNDLRLLFYGMYNINIPQSMLDLQNPDEFIAKCVGAGYYKIDRLGEIQNLPRDFVGLYRRLDDVGYGFIGKVKNQFLQRYSSLPGDQERRLLSLDKRTRNDFVDSFFSEAVFPYDRNSDGRFIRGKKVINRAIYVDDIFDFFMNKARK